MLTSEGYKMFRGTGEIHNTQTGKTVRTERGDWLYKPEYDCWYVNGSSYPAECVKVVEDETEAQEVEVNLYDTVELYQDCTVQVLRNSATGQESVGWWRNGE